MNSIYNYLKSIENKLSQQEAPEIQFLDIDIYKRDNFNLKTFCLSILQRLANTSYLLNQLKITIDRTKNDIVEQINSNFNNYVVLISKLQNIDFLIENINKSLEIIKEKLTAEISLVLKYESELKQMIMFIKENDAEIIKVNEMMKKYDNAVKSKKILEEIEIMISEAGGISIKSDYTLTRKYLIKVLRFYDIKSKGIINTDEEINKYSLQFSQQTDEIFSYALEKLFTVDNTATKFNKIDLKLLSNRFGLIYQIAIRRKDTQKLYEKIYDQHTKNDLNCIFDKGLPLSKTIDAIIQLMHNDKYKLLSQEFNSKEFLNLCFLSPFIKKYSNDKLIFNCSDSVIFKNNYSSILHFISFFDLKDFVESLRSFLQTFSFFTYFQYIQNDMSMKFIDLFKESNENIITRLGNCIFNYTKIIQEIFIEKKIYLKNIPNFLNFMLQCTILIKLKVNEINNTNETIKLSQVNEIPYELDAETNRIVEAYKTSLNNYITYFNQTAIEKNLQELIDRESFLCKSNQDYMMIINEKDKIIKSIREQIALIVL